MTYDALAQTHFLRDGRLWSRYPPGFPALLAMAGALFGEVGEHALNPLLYLLLLVAVVVMRASSRPRGRSRAPWGPLHRLEEGGRHGAARGPRRP